MFKIISQDKQPTQAEIDKITAEMERLIDQTEAHGDLAYHLQNDWVYIRSLAIIGRIVNHSISYPGGYSYYDIITIDFKPTEPAQKMFDNVPWHDVLPLNDEGEVLKDV